MKSGRYFFTRSNADQVHIFTLAHCCDVIMGAVVSQIISVTIVYSTIHSGADQRKHQSSASLTFVRGIPRWPVNSPSKWPVMRKMFPFDDVIMWRDVVLCMGMNIRVENFHYVIHSQHYLTLQMGPYLKFNVSKWIASPSCICLRRTYACRSI